MRRLYRFTVSPQHDGERLDKVVPIQTEDISVTLLRKIVDIGGVHVEGRRRRECSMALRSGWKVEIYLDGLPLTPFRLGDKNIIFRDRYILVINKPAGVDTQPTHARYKGTLYEALKLFLQDPNRPSLRPALGMVQRLDRGTSGIMVFSTHPRAHKGLSRCFADRLAEKKYLALVEGTPERKSGEIRSMLARERKSRRVKSVPAGGKDAVTRFRLVERLGSMSLLEIDLLTGRSHQIRAHLSEEGLPIAGDALYGGPEEIEEAMVSRQMLHASSLSFSHPVTGEVLTFEAPVPNDMRTLLENCRIGRNRTEPESEPPK